jgi:glycosyltransferase involved in cell wall biosynthesis
MHLVYAIDNLGSGGAQRQSVELAVHLARRDDLRVGFLVYRDDDFHAERLAEAGVPVTRIPKGGRLDPRLPLRIRRWLRAERPDLVHAFIPLPCLWNGLAARSLPAASRPVFVAAERSAFDVYARGHDLARRLAYPLADAVTVNAERMRAEIEARLGIPAARLHYLPNGIDLEAWDAEAAGPSPIELEPGRFHLALVGGLRREKNHRLAVEALARLGPERTRDWRLWFVGGRTGEPGYAEEVERAIAEHGLGEQVRIVPPVRRIAALMARLDGLILPSAYEGFPNVVLEAMATRLPVIASRVGDVPNLVEAGRSGLLLERLDAEALADALGRLRGLPAGERAELGARARTRVEAHFGMEAVAERHLALYRQLVGTRHAGRARP